MKKSNLLVSCLLFFFASVSVAQDRFMVFFTDKENSEFSIDQPEEFLSQKAIDRRLKFDIPIDEKDLPVNSSYVKSIDGLGAEVYYTSKWMNGALVQMDADLRSTIEAEEYVEGVEYIAPGAKLSWNKSEFSVPDTFEDPSFQMATSELQNAMIGVDKMHESNYRGQDIMIAVFDAGFEGVNTFKPFENLHKENRLIAAKDFVYNTDNPFQYHDHGTEVISCIAADYPEFVGTAPEASYIIAVTEDVKSEFRVEEYNWLLAAEFADSAGTDIIHSSLGYSVFGKEPSMNYSYQDMDGNTAVITRAVNLAVSRGILVVTSAGNEGNSSWKYITAPADARNILAVGAITKSYTKSGFSSVGPTLDGRIKPDVVALGSGVAIMLGNGQITNGNGTSYAAPQVAGLAAGVWQANPDWSNVEVVNAIKLTASRAFNADTAFGYGVPNFEAATVGRVLSISDIISDKIKVYPNPFKDNRVWIDFQQMEDIYPVTVRVIDMKGATVASQNINSFIQKAEISIPAKEPGVYFLKLSSDSFSKTVKLIKY